MNDRAIKVPANYNSILESSNKIQFSMPSDLQTGSLLRTLVASTPSARILELGTGTGLSLAWIADALDENSQVISIDNSETYLNIARCYFAENPQIEIICADGDKWLQEYRGELFDLIFADAWPGKYSSLDEALALLKQGGIYLIDDMLAQPNWPEGHQENVDKLISYLESREDLKLTQLEWSTGIVIVVKVLG